MRTGRPKAPLVLTDEERATLTALGNRSRTRPHLALRARLVLLCADGLASTVVARKLRVRDQTVSKWRGRFVRDRLEGLYDEPRPGAPRTITDDAVERVVQGVRKAGGVDDIVLACGPFPRTMAHVATRQKEIQFSSRTRAESNRFKELQRAKNAVAELLATLPDDLADSPEARRLRSLSERKVGNLIQLIYRSKEYEGDSKDYEFSRRSMEEHWSAGYHDTVRTLRHPEVLERPTSPDGVFIFDIHQHGRE